MKHLAKFVAAAALLTSCNQLQEKTVSGPSVNVDSLKTVYQDDIEALKMQLIPAKNVMYQDNNVDWPQFYARKDDTLLKYLGEFKKHHAEMTIDTEVMANHEAVYHFIVQSTEVEKLRY